MRTTTTSSRRLSTLKALASAAAAVWGSTRVVGRAPKESGCRSSSPVVKWLSSASPTGAPTASSGCTSSRYSVCARSGSLLFQTRTPSWSGPKQPAMSLFSLDGRRLTFTLPSAGSISTSPSRWTSRVQSTGQLGCTGATRALSAGVTVSLAWLEAAVRKLASKSA